MAVYRMEAKIVTRRTGQSACAAAAYRAGCEIEDHRTGQLHDYTRKRGIEHEEIMTPANAPDWAQDRAQLWNAVEERENRKNSQLARELLLSLPHELDAEQRRELVREYVRQEYVEKKQIAADIAIHEAHRQGDERNHHAHVLLTLRRIEAEGWAKHKERDFTNNREKQAEQMIAERQLWADYQNRAFERAGIEARVDHRSLADRDIDREPEPKLGPVASKMEREGRASNAGDDLRAVRERNAERARLAEDRKIIDLEIERERRRLEQAFREARVQDGYAKAIERDAANENRAREVERETADTPPDDGYAHAVPTEPSYPAVDMQAEIDRRQEEALRGRVAELAAQIEGRGAASLLWNKILGRIAWDAEHQLSAQRDQLAQLEQARSERERQQAQEREEQHRAQQLAQERAQERQQEAKRELEGHGPERADDPSPEPVHARAVEPIPEARAGPEIAPASAPKEPEVSEKELEEQRIAAAKEDAIRRQREQMLEYYREQFAQARERSGPELER